MKIQDLEPQERPREKALKRGIRSLSNRELLAVLLQSGTRKHDVLELADEVMALCGFLDRLMQMQPKDLMQIHGIKQVRAVQLFAGIELSRRIVEIRMERSFVHSPEDLVLWLKLQYGYAQQEHFAAVYLNQQNAVIHHQILFLGTLNAATIHPREIFKEAIRCSASALICAHNHPSGDVSPSSADKKVTETIAESGKIVGIPLVDHLIIGQNEWFSFRQSGLL